MIHRFRIAFGNHASVFTTNCSLGAAATARRSENDATFMVWRFVEEISWSREDKRGTHFGRRIIIQIILQGNATTIFQYSQLYKNTGMKGVRREVLSSDEIDPLQMLMLMLKHSFVIKSQLKHRPSRLYYSPPPVSICERETPSLCGILAP